MITKPCLVITSIASHELHTLKALAEQSMLNHAHMILVGDAKSPVDFKLKGCDYFSLQQQKELSFEYASLCPEGIYARKNIGYLIAASSGSPDIIETDDDNIPTKGFWHPKQTTITAPLIQKDGWVNVYRYFSNLTIWPRGLPLHKVHSPIPGLESAHIKTEHCPIQQGLVNNDPDVDAIYRLTSPLPITFEDNVTITLDSRTWCPFNSQNTWWSKEAYPLMYLPATCEMRLTDIWRSFVAQRVAWEYNWKIAFHSPTAYQTRNEHDLSNDLNQELKGLLHNNDIKNALLNLKLSNKQTDIYKNVMTCYKTLVSMKLIDPAELELLKSWLKDLKSIDL